MATQIESKDRPEPIRDAATYAAYGLGAIVAAVVFLGSKGVLSTADVSLVAGYADVLNGWVKDLASAAQAVIAGGSVLGGIKLAARHATGNSTPSDDPRDRDGTALMRVDGKPLGGYELPPVYVDGAPLNDDSTPPTSSFTAPPGGGY